MRNFFAELQRRKVYRVAIAYVVAGWALAQGLAQVLPVFDTPNWVVKLAVILIIVGFPFAMFLSWVFDITPQGIKRTEDLVPAVPSPSFIPEKSIAVLPFENLSDDQANTYFADGIQDDILSSLAKVADLKVISRTSVRQYRGGSRNLREIGAALGVAHILEGTVRRSGNRVRVNAQLIDARTDDHVWADTFDREMEDLFALQSELAQQIAAALRANISPREQANLQMHPTADLDAYDLYLQARDLYRWSGAGDPKENGEKALHLLGQALERDPQFALAHALASRFHAELYWFGYDRSNDRLTRAKSEAETALRVHPELGDARLALAYYHYYGAHEYDLARKQLALAQQATPNDAEVWDATAAVDRRQGHWQEAVVNFEKAWQLDPRNASVIWNLAETYACLGRYNEAKRVFAQGLAVNPRAYLFAVAEATIDLKKDGDLAALSAILESIPHEFDPGGAVTTVALRLHLMKREYEKVAQTLERSHHREFNDSGIGGTASSLDGYTFVKEWYEGLAAQGQGDASRAEQLFGIALRLVQADPRQCSSDAKTNSMLGLINAALGRKEEAVAYGSRAVELLPVSLDAYDGPVMQTNLAVIYAQTGEMDRAMEQLAMLLKTPNGATPGTLRVEPEWDALRKDPRFEKLIS
jgi:TolB-like protein/Flp pilus assembly protein TadD